MPPDTTTTGASTFGKRLLTVPAVLRLDRHDLVYLLDRQQPAAGPAMSRLAAALPSGMRRIRAHRRLGRIRGRRARGIGGSLAQAGFQLLDLLVQGRMLR